MYNYKYHFNLSISVFNLMLAASRPNFAEVTHTIFGTVKKFPELWYSTVIVGHMTTLT
jgi:hypothetical protein